MNEELEKMYESMAKLNPDFKLNEGSFGKFDSNLSSTQTQQQQSQDIKQGDVKRYQKALTTSKLVGRTGEKVNTAVEFPEAFKAWFKQLGYSPENQNITTSRVIASIKQAMADLGYK